MAGETEAQWPVVQRRAFLSSVEDEARKLLARGFARTAADSERWSLLRFRDVDEAVEWALARWQAPYFAAEQFGPYTDILEMKLWVFACEEAWQWTRLAEVQERERREGRFHHEHGHSRKEITNSAFDQPPEPVAQPDVAPTLAGDEAVRAALRGAVDDFAARIEVGLEALGRRTHRAQEILWLQHQRRLRKALGELDVERIWEARDGTTAPVMSDASKSDHAKAAALAAFRYAVLFEQVEPRQRTLEARAFVLTHLTNFEKPRWSMQPRDRWDQVPKRVVSAWLSAEGLPARSNEVAAAVRRQMGRLVQALMDRGRDLVDEPPEDWPARAELGLHLLLLADSLVATLCDEYGRKAGAAADGPSAAALLRWRNELDAERARLGSQGRRS